MTFKSRINKAHEEINPARHTTNNFSLEDEIKIGLKTLKPLLNNELTKHKDPVVVVTAALNFMKGLYDAEVQTPHKEDVEVGIGYQTATTLASAYKQVTEQAKYLSAIETQLVAVNETIQPNNIFGLQKIDLITKELQKLNEMTNNTEELKKLTVKDYENVVDQGVFAATNAITQVKTEAERTEFGTQKRYDLQNLQRLKEAAKHLNLQHHASRKEEYVGLVDQFNETIEDKLLGHASLIVRETLDIAKKEANEKSYGVAQSKIDYARSELKSFVDCFKDFENTPAINELYAQIETGKKTIEDSEKLL